MDLVQRQGHLPTRDSLTSVDEGTVSEEDHMRLNRRSDDPSVERLSCQVAKNEFN